MTAAASRQNQPDDHATEFFPGRRPYDGRSNGHCPDDNRKSQVQQDLRDTNSAMSRAICPVHTPPDAAFITSLPEMRIASVAADWNALPTRNAIESATATKKPRLKRTWTSGGPR